MENRKALIVDYIKLAQRRSEDDPSNTQTADTKFVTRPH